MPEYRTCDELHMKKKKGEITAFLSLVLVLLVSFILAMAQSAQIQTAKNLKRLAVDRAIFSVFGEYQKSLLEEYEVFAFDGSYETGHYDEQQILNRMSYYGSMGIEQTITDLQLLTDNSGQAFREQVLEFMEMKTGIGILQDMTGLAADWEEQKQQGEEVSGQLDQVLSQGEDLLPEENAGVLEVRSTGILSLVLPDEFELSGKYVDRSGLVSSRSRNTGRGSFPARTGTENPGEKVLFGQYIADKFNTAVEQKSESRNLDYEIEYLVGGNESDEENLKDVVNQLLLVRMGLNYVHLMADAGKQGEADAMALAIATVVLRPEIKDAVKQLLLLLWCFGESVVDVRTLLAGRKAALIKNASNWQLPLSAIFTFWLPGTEYEGTDSEDGLNYGQYLQILLFLKDAETLNMRALDRIEQNLRFELGQEYFYADSCVTKVKLYNQAEMWSGYSYSFPAYYGYL